MKEDETQCGPFDQDTVEALRTRLAVPGGDRYWESLHAAIMARIIEVESQAWWTVLSRWSRPALAAAALVMIVATAAMLAMRADRTVVAYDEVLEAQAQVPVQTAQTATPGSAREATFHFVMSSNGGRAP